MDGMTLDELITKLLETRMALGRGDIAIEACVGANEYHVSIVGVNYVTEKDTVFLYDGNWGCAAPGFEP